MRRMRRGADMAHRLAVQPPGQLQQAPVAARRADQRDAKRQVRPAQRVGRQAAGHGHRGQVQQVDEVGVVAQAAVERDRVGQHGVQHAHQAISEIAETGGGRIGGGRRRGRIGAVGGAPDAGRAGGAVAAQRLEETDERRAEFAQFLLIALVALAVVDEPVVIRPRSDLLLRSMSAGRTKPLTVSSRSS